MLSDIRNRAARDIGYQVAMGMFIDKLNPERRGPHFCWDQLEGLAAREAEREVDRGGFGVDAAAMKKVARYYCVSMVANCFRSSGILEPGWELGKRFLGDAPENRPVEGSD